MGASDRDRDEDPREAEGARERLSPSLVAEVLAGFGLTSPSRIRTIERGSRRAPKVVVECSEGVFFLKRRRPGAVEAARFTAQLQRRLAASGCPVPAVRSTVDGEAVLEHQGHVFELVEFVSGVRYPRDASAAFAAGRTLVRLHEEVRGLSAPEGLRGSYHDSSLVREVLARLGDAAPTGTFLDRYDRAASLVDRWSQDRPRRLLHGDYHPGNLLHDAADPSRVRAVLDWEAVRVDLPVAEFASAAVHFSLPPSAVDAGREGLDLELLAAFSKGFGSTTAETGEVVPSLMIESVVAEVAFLLDGGGRLDRSERLRDAGGNLVVWIDRHRESISGIVRGDRRR